MQIITATLLTASYCFTALFYFTAQIKPYHGKPSSDSIILLHLVFDLSYISFVFKVFFHGIGIAFINIEPNTLTMEDIMKGFMKMFEEIMVAVAFAEAGISVLFLQQKNNLHEELEEQAWDLR